MQHGTIQQSWAALYVLSCIKFTMTLMLENQTSKALLFGQKALVVARAAKLQSSHLYAVLLKHMLNICMKLQPGFGVRHGEHAVPFEGFITAVAQVKLTFPSSTAECTKIDIFVLEHTCWVKELQAELVRCGDSASFHVCCSQLFHEHIALGIKYNGCQYDEYNGCQYVHCMTTSLFVYVNLGCAVCLRNKMLWLDDTTNDGLKFRHTLIGVVDVTRSCYWKALTVCHSVLHHVLLDLML